MASLHTLKVVCGIVLLCSLACFIVTTLHWPLVNDAALMHYVVFLMDHGMAPYREIADMNLPGTYFVEWIVIHTLGGSDVAWRLFDFLLLGAAGTAMISLAKPYGRFAGLFAAALFALFHGRDGAGQLGQRDLSVAVLLLASCAFAFAAMREQRFWLMIPFGASSGLAMAIKPTAGLSFIFLLAMALAVLSQQHKAAWKYAITSVAGFLLPCFATLIFLIKQHSVSAFLATLSGEIVYHAATGNRGFRYLLTWSLTPSVLTLLAFAVIIAVSRRDWRRWEATAIFGCALLGWISFLLQKKGFPYHRYPMLAFLFLWIGIQLSEAAKGRTVVRAIGVAGLLYGSIALAPLYALRAKKSHWNQDLVVSLQRDLNQLGGSKLSGHIQCIDSISGCTTALYNMRLLQSTGTIYDEFLFGPGVNPIIRSSRDRFLTEIQEHPPQIMVVTDPLFPAGPDDYKKLKLWATFDSYLTANYTAVSQRSFSPGGTGRLGYRIYVQKTL